MKGLLLKDIYMAAKYCRLYVLMALIFALVSVWSDNLLFAAYPVLLASAVPVNLLAYDEKDKWALCAGALPVTRAQLVSVKYLMTLIALGISLLFAGLGLTVNALVTGGAHVSALLSYLCLFFSAGLLCPALMLPIVFRLGVEKGRFVYICVLLLFFGLMSAAGVLGAAMGASFETLALSAGQIAGLLALMLLLCAALFAGSWLLSVRVYAKRDLPF